MNTTTSLPAIATAMNATRSSSSSDVEFYFSVIGKVFDSAGSFIAALGFWIVLGVALALCLAAIAVLLTCIIGPFVLCISSSQESTEQSAREEGMRMQRERDLEANARAPPVVERGTTAQAINAVDVPNEHSSLTAGVGSVHEAVEEVIFTPSTEEEEVEEEDEKASSTGSAEHDDSDLDEEDPLHEGKSLGGGPVNFR